MLFKQKERIKRLMQLYRKRGMDCSQKATSIPLYLKSKIQNQGEEDGGYEHYLVFLEKREESRNFDVFLCFLGEIYGDKREKKLPRKMPKQLPKCLPFNLSCQEPFIGLGTFFEAQRTLLVRQRPLLVHWVGLG